MKKKILVIIILLLILILCGGIAYAYLFTDALKSDKQLFFKYISENKEILEFFQDEDLENYSEKQQNYAYTSSGSIVIDNSEGITFSSNIEDIIDSAQGYCDLIANQYLNESIVDEENDNTEEDEDIDKKIINILSEGIDIEGITVNASYSEEGNSTILLTYTDGSTSEGTLNDGEIIWGTANLFSSSYNLSNSSIVFTTNTDKANNYVYKNINLNYSNEESLNVEYINNQDYYGIKINDVVNKYITIKNSDLKEFATVLELDDEIIEAMPDSIDFDEIFSSEIFTEEELSELKSKYLNVLEENLTDDMFSQSETASDDVKIYTLTITEEQFYSISVKLLEQLKEDEIIFNKVSELMANETDYSETEINETINQIKDQIQEYIDELNESTGTTTENNIVINVYVNNRALIKTEILIDDDDLTITKNEDGFSFEYSESGATNAYILNIAKTKTDGNLNYTISCLNGSTQIFSLSINFSGLTSEQVTEKSTFAINYDVYNLSYTYNNTKNFASQVSQDVTTDDMLVLNTATSLENIENLFNQIVDRLDEVNSEQMSNLGVDENPMIYYVPSAVPVLGVYTLKEGGLLTSTIVAPTATIIVTGMTVYNSAVNTMQEVNLEDVDDLDTGTDTNMGTSNDMEVDTNTDTDMGTSTDTEVDTDSDDYETVGTIEIPEIDIKYDIYSDLSTTTLNKGIVIVSTDEGLNQEGNTVLSGHNLLNGTFFSDIDELELGDYIYITDEEGNTLTYVTYGIYEVEDTDTTYMSRDTNGNTEITLTTSTDDSSMRWNILARLA